VESVDIKRLPDGSSRGFAFVKFADKELQGEAAKIPSKFEHLACRIFFSLCACKGLGAEVCGSKG
jgi:RNA recognition motif-containing protein